jgi:hypothetical protein
MASFTPRRYPIAKPIAQPPAAHPKTTSPIRAASNVHANEVSDKQSQVIYWERTDPTQVDAREHPSGVGPAFPEGQRLVEGLADGREVVFRSRHVRCILVY